MLHKQLERAKCIHDQIRDRLESIVREDEVVPADGEAKDEKGQQMVSFAHEIHNIASVVNTLNNNYEYMLERIEL